MADTALKMTTPACHAPATFLVLLISTTSHTKKRTVIMDTSTEH